MLCDMDVSFAFPRFLYKIAGEIGWRQMIKQNGGKGFGRYPRIKVNTGKEEKQA